MNLFLVTTAVLLFNIPFGFWRGGVKKYSLKWFMFIHLPIPAIILLRIYSNIGFAPDTYLFLVSAFFIGQKMGVYFYENRQKFNEKIEQILLKNCAHINNEDLSK